MTQNTEVMTLNEVTTHNGTITIGDHFHDKRTEHRRWLKVDRIETTRYATTVYYTVTAQLDETGTLETPMRTNDMKPDRLLGRDFVRTTGPGINS